MQTCVSTKHITQQTHITWAQTCMHVCLLATRAATFVARILYRIILCPRANLQYLRYPTRANLGCLAVATMVWGLKACFCLPASWVHVLQSRAPGHIVANLVLLASGWGVGLRWVGLGWVGLGWVGLGWVGLGLRLRERPGHLGVRT